MVARKVCLVVVMAMMVLLGLVTNVRAWPDLPPAKAFISGPGIEGELEITDAAVLDVLRLGGVEDIGWGTIAKQAGLTDGFKIVRYFDGGEFHYGDLWFYPNATPARSMVYFEDALNGSDGPSPLNKKWLYATANGDKVLQGYLKTIGAKFNTGKAQPQKMSTAKFDALPETIVVGKSVTLGFTLPQEFKVAPVSLHREGESHRIVLAANAAGAAGHYEFSYTFKEAGTWDWAVRPTYNDVEIPMPPLYVVEGAAVKQVQPKAEEPAQEPAIAAEPVPANPIGFEPLTMAIATVAGVVGVAGIVGVLKMRRK